MSYKIIKIIDKRVDALSENFIHRSAPKEAMLAEAQHLIQLIDQKRNFARWVDDGTLLELLTMRYRYCKMVENNLAIGENNA